MDGFENNTLSIVQNYELLLRNLVNLLIKTSKNPAYELCAKASLPEPVRRDQAIRIRQEWVRDWKNSAGKLPWDKMGEFAAVGLPREDVIENLPTLLDGALWEHSIRSEVIGLVQGEMDILTKIAEACIAYLGQECIKKLEGTEAVARFKKEFAGKLRFTVHEARHVVSHAYNMEYPEKRQGVFLDRETFFFTDPAGVSTKEKPEEFKLLGQLMREYFYLHGVKEHLGILDREFAKRIYGRLKWIAAERSCAEEQVI